MPINKKCKACGSELVPVYSGWVCSAYGCDSRLIPYSPKEYAEFSPQYRSDREAVKDQLSNEVCRWCSGSGKQECDECGGSGIVECEYGHEHDCPECDGEGVVECDECDG